MWRQPCPERPPEGGDSDFLAAYRFIDTHPAFWVRRASDSNRAVWLWETNGHMNRVDLSVAMPTAEIDAAERHYKHALDSRRHGLNRN